MLVFEIQGVFYILTSQLGLVIFKVINSYIQPGETILDNADLEGGI